MKTTKAELMDELTQLRQRVSELEASETERKQAEEALQESEENFRSLAENSQDYIMRYDEECRHLYENPAALRVSGLTEEDIIGKTHREAGFDEELSDLWEEKITRVFKTGESSQTVFEWQGAEGPVYLDWRLFPEFDESGQVKTVLGISRDITERKQAEAMLRESEERLRNFVDSATDGFALFDSEMNYMDVNEAALAQGPFTSKEEVIGKNIREIIPDVEETGRYDKYLEVAKTGKSLFVDELIPHPMFGDVHLALRAFKVGDGVGIITRDITERKRVEEALKSERDKLQALTDGLARTEIGIDIIGLDYKVISQNQTLQERFGDLTGKLCYESYMGLEKPCDFCPMTKAVKGNKVESVELTAADGRDYRLLSAPLPNPDGTVDKAIEVVMDITERKRVEEALRNSERKFRSIFEHTHDGIALVDEQGAIIDWSPGQEAITGLKRDEVLGQPAWEVMPRLVSGGQGGVVTPEQMKAQAQQMLRQGPSPQMSLPQDVTIQRPDGTLGTFEETTFTIETEKGFMVGVICRDITERKRAEEALRKSEKQASAAIEAARAITFNYDIATGKIECGGAIDEITGYTSEEFAKVDIDGWAERIHPDDRDQTLSILQDAMGKDRATAEYRFKTKKGYITLASISLTEKQDDKAVGLVGILQDITERKQAEEVIRQSEEKYRRLFELGSDALFLIETETGRILDLNDAAIQTHGYSREEALQMNNTDFSAEPDKTRQATAEAEGQIPLRYHKRKDGSIFPTDISVAYFTQSGKEVCVAAIRDITDRKQAEEALRQSEERYRTILEAMEDGYHELDLAGNFTFFNDSMCRMLGYSRKEMMGMNYRAYTSPEDVKAVFKDYNRVYRTGKPMKALSYKTIRKDGSAAFAEVSVFPLRNKDGEVVGFRGIRRDITERKRMEEVLRQSEERYRTILEEMEDAYFEVDLAGNYTFVNDANCRVLGCSREELLGAGYRPYMAEEDAKTVFKAFLQVYRTGEPNRDLSYRVVRKDGSTGFIQLSGFALRNREGEIIGFRGVARDIAERKQAEEALKRSEENLRTYLEDAPDGIFLSDLEGTFLYGNKKAEEIIGYKREKLVGKSFLRLNLLPEEYLGKAGEALALNVRGEPASPEEFELVRKDGSRLWVEINSVPLKQAEGTVVLGFVRDITERKEAEEALTDEAIKRRILIEQSRDGIVVLDQNGKVYEVNQRFAEILGYSLEEAHQLYVWDWDTQWTHEQLLEMIGSVDATGDHFETQHRRKDGTNCDVEISTNGAVFAGQKLVFCVCRDITERKKAEEALQESQEFASSLLSNSPNAIEVINADTSIRYINPALEELTGFSSAEVIGKKAPYPWWTEENVAKGTGGLRKAIRKGEARHEKLFKKKNGEPFWVEKTSEPVRRGGEFLYFVSSWVDITERKQMEEERKELEQKAQMESRLASLGLLASGVGHEINNPLTGVIGYAQLLLGRDVPEDIKKDLRAINEGAQRVANIVKKLVAFARYQKPQRAYAGISDIVAATVDLLAHQLETSNIKTNLHLDPNLPWTIADIGQLQQVFLNLIINAETEMRLAHGKGKLSIKTGKADNTIRISFQDDGPGIAEENLEKIFDPFFTTREVGEGTGLGLSICHEIIAEHGGRIYAESKSGKGATFIVELPVVTEEKHPQAAKPVAEEPAKVPGARILVVDDEPVILDFVSRVLTDEGHEVETVDNAADALGKIETERYSLILLDIKMPGMSGIELYNHIEKTAQSLARRVVFITGDVMGAETTAFLSRTKAPRIDKPFDAEQLKSEIDRILARGGS